MSYSRSAQAIEAAERQMLHACGRTRDACLICTAEVTPANFGYADDDGNIYCDGHEAALSPWQGYASRIVRFIGGQR